MRTIHISDLGEIVTGNTPPRSQPDLYGDYIPFIKATDIVESQKYTRNPEECYSEKGFQKYKKSLIPAGSTCVVTIGSIGKKMTMAHCNCFINQAMNAIIPNDHFDSEYVYYVIKYNLHKLKSLNLGTASGRENVSKSTFSSMEIDVFEDIYVQRKIGRILSAYDALIENSRKQIKLLEEAAQRLYKEWFVDLRFPGYKTARFVDGLPEGWKKVCLESICAVQKRVIPPSSILPNTAYIGLEHMPRNDICLSDWDDSSNITSSKFKYQENDILFGKIRPYFHKVGFALNSGVASTDSIIMRSSATFWGLLLMTVSSDTFVDYTYQTCREGAKMPRADWTQMKIYPVLVANDEIQRQFEQRIQTLTKSVKNHAIQIRLLAESRDRLLPKLMSAALEV